jgi:hypothetical protein
MLCVPVGQSLSDRYRQTESTNMVGQDLAGQAVQHGTGCDLVMFDCGTHNPKHQHARPLKGSITVLCKVPSRHRRQLLPL